MAETQPSREVVLSLPFVGLWLARASSSGSTTARSITWRGGHS
ncbi:MAG TPA: hypothetical protein VFR87_09095 [Nocardioidaceae bacterium]|nr:hypothetical protein [Nocardioidaceae bacterium]